MLNWLKGIFKSAPSESEVAELKKKLIRIAVGMLLQSKSLTEIQDFLMQYVAASDFPKQDVIATIQHDPSRVLGRTKSGTLRLAQDDTGLSFRVALDPINTEHTNLRAGILRGDWDSCSFAFTVPDGGDSWDSGTDEDGKRCAIRTLRNVNLMDVAIVQHPAYPQTEVSARSLAYYNTSTARSAGAMPTVVTHPHLFVSRKVTQADVDNAARRELAALGNRIFQEKRRDELRRRLFPTPEELAQEREAKLHQQNLAAAQRLGRELLGE